MDDFRRILVPIDFSRSSLTALDRVWSLADPHGSEVHLVHVLTEPFYESEGVKRDRTRKAHERLDQLMPSSAEMDIRICRQVTEGKAPEALIAYAKAEDVDVIVMGTHGRSGVRRAVMGSVAERVIRSSPVPVMTVRAEESSSPPPSLVELEAVEADPSRTPPSVDLLRRAMTMRATDIHIDPVADDEYQVRMRIDGLLHHYCRLDHDVASHIIGQFKTMADLPIARPFRPLEGRLHLPRQLSELEVRITTAAVAGGEAAALRLFDRGQVFRPLEDLGLSAFALDRVQDMIHCGEGVVLVTGPTNSGKTTTVYSMLKAVGNFKGNIVSVEDPVEFWAPFVRQLAVDEEHGVTMSTGLRTILRMDPDAIFVGEIRDHAAAEMAMRAASSGKFVLSTLHTRDTPSAVTAMMDLDIDRRSLAANLTGIVNQRLIRKVCEQCGQRRPVRDEDRDRAAALGVAIDADEVVEAVGCEACRQTGYCGRIGVFEVLLADEAIRTAISEGEAERTIRGLLAESQTPTLAADAFSKVSRQITSVGEAVELRWL